jgi:hypothetical protein
MRRASALSILPAAVVGLLLAAGAGATSTAATPPTTRPVVVAAGPVSDPSDRVWGGYRRVTFSPDGDGRDDDVAIRTRVTPGDKLVLAIRPVSQRTVTVPLKAARTPLTTVVWDGMQSSGGRYHDGSYILRVCDETTRQCSGTGVLAHLRLITAYTPRDTAASVGEPIRIRIATDRIGPSRLDLVSVAASAGPGIGAVQVPHPGWIDYRIPTVPYGGLWLLRVRNGRDITHFPLVIHQPGRFVDHPPAHAVLVVYPWLTWRAYDMADTNRDGQVDSWYSHPRHPVVPLFGPFEPATDVPMDEGREANAGAQSSFARWMLEHHLTAQHVTDVELGRLPERVLRRYAEIVFEGHTEYYELPTYERLLRYRDHGGRLYFMQGNSFYGRAQIRGSSLVRLSYRFRTAERSDFALAVTGFRECCWPRTIRPVYHLAKGAVEALPWAFTGTGLKDGDPFGVAAGEVDTVDPQLSPRGTITVATATVPAFTPTSEKEVDGWIGSHPIPYEPAWKRSREIAIAYAKTGKGEVFTWANTGFMKTIGLSSSGLPASERATLDRVALNVWEHFSR